MGCVECIGNLDCQDAFADRRGRPHLSAAERELFLSECCDDCCHLLCPNDKLATTKEIGKARYDELIRKVAERRARRAALDELGALGFLLL
ncbi:MAG: hypothetical protein ABSE28_01970 [Candidatus Sulfotelmatobacter sp.]